MASPAWEKVVKKRADIHQTEAEEALREKYGEHMAAIISVVARISYIKGRRDERELTDVALRSYQNLFPAKNN